jgi:hypothetical protein
MDIRLIDDFLPRTEFLGLQKFSRQVRYQNLDFVTGQRYLGIAPVGGGAALWQSTEEHMGEPIEPVLALFKRYESTETQTTLIHSDFRLADYSIVLPLSDSEDSGTAFWRHKLDGRTLPDLAAPIGEVEDIRPDDESNWEIYRSSTDRAGRAVLFDCRHYHSRYPKVWSKDEPRIVLVVFFNKLSQSRNMVGSSS